MSEYRGGGKREFCLCEEKTWWHFETQGMKILGEVRRKVGLGTVGEVLKFTKQRQWSEMENKWEERQKTGNKIQQALKDGMQERRLYFSSLSREITLYSLQSGINLKKRTPKLRDACFKWTLLDINNLKQFLIVH